MSTPHTAIDLTTTGSTSLFAAAAPASRKRKLDDLVDLTVDVATASQTIAAATTMPATRRTGDGSDASAAEEDDDDGDRKPAARSTPKQPPLSPGWESCSSDEDRGFLPGLVERHRRSYTPKTKKKQPIDPAAYIEMLSWDSDDDRDFIPTSVQRRRRSFTPKKKKQQSSHAAAYPEVLGDNRRRLPVVDEAEDRRLAEQLQAQEEDHYLQAKIQEEQHMLTSTTGKAWKFVEQVLELHKQLLSKKCCFEYCVCEWQRQLR